MPDSLPQGLALAFPGTTLRRNSTQTEAVRAVHAALNARGCGPVEADGVFGPQTDSAVRHSSRAASSMPRGCRSPSMARSGR